MKRKMTCFSTLVVFTTAPYILSGYAQNNLVKSSNRAQVAISSLRTSYVLGEVVALRAEITNAGDADLILPGTDANSGYLKFWVADSTGKYEEYSNSGGNVKKAPKTLKAGQTVASQVTVLANAKQETAHLSEFYVKKATENKITTSYAFPKAGVYYVKTVLMLSSERQITVESDPVQITIEEPVGDDLLVWKGIKDRFDFAYFIQEGQAVDRNDEEKEKFLQEV